MPETGKRVLQKWAEHAIDGVLSLMRKEAMLPASAGRVADTVRVSHLLQLLTRTLTLTLTLTLTRTPPQP